MIDQQAATHRQGGKALGQYFEDHQVAVDSEEQQGHQHGQELADHRDVDAVGRVDHGGEGHTHLDRDDLPGNDENLEEQLQRHAKQGADDDLLGHQQQRLEVQRLDHRHRRQARDDHHGNRQGEIQANARRHKGCTKDRHGHQHSGDAKQRQDETGHPGTNLRIGQLEHRRISQSAAECCRTTTGCIP
ncbi:hypothetical protein D3C77_263990 [compost metagenome]